MKLTFISFKLVQTIERKQERAKIRYEKSTPELDLFQMHLLQCSCQSAEKPDKIFSIQQLSLIICRLVYMLIFLAMTQSK